MKITTNLPKSVHSFKYVKNSHYIELEDDSGKKTKLLASSLIRGECQDCFYEFYSPSNQGKLSCPSCNGTVEWVWGKVQLCFVPEKESDFK